MVASYNLKRTQIFSLPILDTIHKWRAEKKIMNMFICQWFNSFLWFSFISVVLTLIAHYESAPCTVDFTFYNVQNYGQKFHCSLTL